MAERYDYLIVVRKFKTRVATYQFAAKVSYIVKISGANSERINPGLREQWGVTQQEAEGKARAEADRWLEQQHHSISSAIV